MEGSQSCQFPRRDRENFWQYQQSETTEISCSFQVEVKPEAVESRYLASSPHLNLLLCPTTMNRSPPRMMQSIHWYHLEFCSPFPSSFHAVARPHCFDAFCCLIVHDGRPPLLAQNLHKTVPFFFTRYGTVSSHFNGLFDECFQREKNILMDDRDHSFTILDGKGAQISWKTINRIMGRAFCWKAFCGRAICCATFCVSSAVLFFPYRIFICLKIVDFPLARPHQCEKKRKDR